MTDPSPSMEGLLCPLPLPHNERIVMGHGSGGRMAYDLISKVFLPLFENPILRTGDDAGSITIMEHGNSIGDKLAISTDSHVVMPLFFPGGDSGRIALCGTVNDVSMLGATPHWLTAGFILEEGLEIHTLCKVVESMQVAAAEANVRIIAGDTK